MKEQFIQRCLELSPHMVEIRRHLHQNPEVGMDLPETIAYVKKKLTEAGLDVTECGKGLTATIGSRGKTILLRADMDALPSIEETDIPFKSINGSGHLCGHDMHTAMLITAAQVLKENEDKLSGRVKFMFQPAEEQAQGAENMIEAGLLENPNVDAALALHVMPHKENGTISYVKGAACSSIDGFLIDVTGKGGHGSMPEDTVDPLFAVSTMYNMLNGLVGRESSCFENAVLTVGQLGGGNAPNIIPETAVLNGTIRCFNNEVRGRLIARLEEIIDYVSKAAGVSVNYQLFPTPGLYNNPDLCDEMAPYIADIVGENNLVEDDKPMSGSEDFSYLSLEVPSMFMMLGTGDPTYLPLHNPGVKFEEDYMYRGSATMAYCAYRWLESQGDLDSKGNNEEVKS